MRGHLYVAAILLCAGCDGGGGGGDGGDFDSSDSGEPVMMPPDGEGAVLPEIGLTFPDGEVVREPFPGFPAGEAPDEAPVITNATLDGNSGMLTFDLEVGQGSEMIEFQLQFSTGDVVEFHEPVSDAAPLPVTNIVPGWTFHVLNEGQPWRYSASVVNCWDQSGVEELTEGCFETCVESCKPDAQCSQWFCLDLGLDEAECQAWMQTETARVYGRSARGQCMHSCSHVVGLLDFHRSGGTRAANYFLETGPSSPPDAEATAEASLATIDALLEQTSPEAVAANYIEVVFEQLYCGAFASEPHESLWGFAGGLNCLSNGEGSLELLANDPYYEAERNYLLCKLDGQLPDLPPPPPVVSPRKSKRVYRPFTIRGGTVTSLGAAIVAKDGSIISVGENVTITLPDITNR